MENMRNLSIEQMGEKVGEKTVELNIDMLLALGAKETYSNYDNPDESPTGYCCFCASGNLQLKKVKPLIDDKSVHYGNHYTYMCTMCYAVYRGTLIFSIKEPGKEPGLFE